MVPLVRTAAALLAVLILLEARAMTADAPSVLKPKNRFLDGSIDASRVKLVPSVTPIDSFEDADAVTRDWKAGGGAAIDVVEERATDGRKALKVAFAGKDSTLAYTRGTPWWGDDAMDAWSTQIIFNDEARLDVFNAEAQPVTLLVTMGRTFRCELKPGANELALKTRDMLDSAWRSAQIIGETRFAVEGGQPATLTFDRFRWVGPGLGENLIRFAKCFDCGRGVPAEWVRPNFQSLTPLTGYDPRRGLGWEKPLEKEIPYDKSGMSAFGSTGRQPHDQLNRDMIVRVQSPLLVDLSDGRWRAQWVEGVMFAYPDANLPCDYDLSLRANDKLIPVRRGARTFEERLRYFYGRERVDWANGLDWWSAYMADWFSPQECEFDVRGGRLKLEFVTDPPGRANLTFLILYPVDKAADIEPEIAALWSDIRYRANVMACQIATPETAKERNLPGLHEEFIDPASARARAEAIRAMPAAASGLVAFARETIDDVYPDTVPEPGDIADRASAFAPAGEIASIAVNLYALRDVKGLKVSVGPFASAEGKTLPASATDLRFVQYSFRPGQATHGDWKFMVMPWYLVRRGSVAMSAGTSARWWLNVDLPPDTPAGTYSARATISAEGLAGRTMTLEIEVPPVKLDPVPAGLEFSTVWGQRVQWGPIPDGGWRSMTLRVEPDKAKEWAKALRARMLERIAAEFRLMKRYGINFIYRRGDLNESADGPIALPPELAGMLPMLDFAEVKGPHKYDTPVEVADRPYVAALRDFTLAGIEKARRNGRPPALFGPPKPQSDLQLEPGIYRLSSGFLLWRLGAGGCVFDPWFSPLGDPYNPFDSHVGERGSLCVPSDRDWPTLNTAVTLEGIREGILDYRYVATLEHLVKERPDARDAKQCIEQLRASVEPDGSAYFVPAHDAKGGWDQTWHKKSAAWSGADYLAARRKLAGFIAKLQAAP